MEGGIAATGGIGQTEIRALRLLDGYESPVAATIFWEDGIRKWDHEWTRDGISGLHYIAFWGIAEIALPGLRRKNGA